MRGKPFTDQQDKALIELLGAIKAFRDNRQLMKTQEAMWLSALLARFVETLVDGEPYTPLPTRHHS